MSGCQTVREMLMDVARGAAGDPRLHAHLEGCPDCRRCLANERMLSAGLAASAVRDFPPASVQAAVLEEFRKAHRPIPMRRLPIKWLVKSPVAWIGLAAAATILLAFFVATRQRPQKIVATVATPVHASLPASTARLPIAHALTAKAQQPPVKRRRAARVQPPPSAEAQVAPEVATDFFEIPYTEPLRSDERADVFRVQMPRANMAVFGLPFTGGPLDSQVTADLLIGEDGVMRAIRFVR